MTEELSKQERTERLATRILEQARGQLISENHFLAVATGLLHVAFAQLAGALATDGRTLYVDAPHLVKNFSASGEVPVHDYVHVLMHCVLLHPFVGREVDAQAWDLACDMVAESLAAEICGPRKGVRGAQQQLVLKQVAKDIAGALTAERLYRELRDGAYANAHDLWGELFHVDNHAGWHQQAANDAGTGGAAGPAQSVEAQTDQHAESGAPTQAPSPFQQGAAPDAGAGTDSSRSGEGGSAYRDGLADGTGTDALARGGDGQPEQDDAPAQPRPLTPRELDEVRHAWEHAAKSMRVDLETLSRKRGERLGGLMRELEVSTHEQVDYREFLRQFAVRGEHLHVSDDEFDYVFYTYGLELYDDMPLIEPLEYRDERRTAFLKRSTSTSCSATRGCSPTSSSPRSPTSTAGGAPSSSTALAARTSDPPLPTSTSCSPRVSLTTSRASSTLPTVGAPTPSACRTTPAPLSFTTRITDPTSCLPGPYRSSCTQASSRA